MRKYAAMLRSDGCGLLPFLAAAALIVGSSALPSRVEAQQVAVMVDGSPITTYDVEQRTKLDQLATHKTPQKKDVINELIDERIKVHEAQLYRMGATDAQADQAVANMAKSGGLDVKQFTQVLASHGIGLATLKSRFKAEISWNQLVRARYPATLQVDEKEIRDALAKKGESAGAAHDYSLRPIIFIVPKGSSASVINTRIREAEALRTRFENCKDGIELARSLRDVAVRDPVRRSSTDLPAALRDVLNSIPVGKLTKPEVTAQGVEVFALCARTQSSADTPEERKVRQELFTARFEAQSKRYLEQVRRSSMIEYR
jgi:peptidyl-prolyl cis-trans isomerase SurA